MNAISRIAPATSTPALSHRALVVSLSISHWSGRRLDRAVTAEVNDSKGAAADAGRFNKLLLPKEALDPIVKLVGETRTEFAKRTLPWMDNGERIMAADAYLAHTAWMRGQEGKFRGAVDKFLADYPGHVLAAQGTRLGQMFDAGDYPTVDDLRTKFSMEVRVLPVPSGDDFRVSMSEAQADAIRAQIEANVAEATQAAVQDVYRRIADVAGRMVERLNAFRPAAGKGDRAEGVFRDSLVENVRDLIGVMPALNIMGDPILAATTERLRELVRHDADTLRADAAIRQDVASKAQAILDSVGEFLG